MSAAVLRRDQRGEPVRASAGVTMFLLGTSSVLFDQPSQRLFLLNPTSTALWCLIGEGADERDLVAFMVRTGVADEPAAARLVARTLAEWRRRGLIDRLLAAESVRRERPALPLDPGTPCAIVLRLGPLRVGLEVRVPALLDAIATVIAHLETLDGPPDLRVGVKAADGRLRFELGTELLAEASRVEEAPTVLKSCLIRLATRAVPHLLAVHAASLERDGACVLLAGESGRGKTTLRLALSRGRRDLDRR